jgi:hypothetical protein
VDPYKLTKQTKHAALKASNTASSQPSSTLPFQLQLQLPFGVVLGHTLPAALSTTCDMGRVCLTGVGGWKSLTGRGTGPPASRQIGRRFLGTLNTGAVPDWHRQFAALTCPRHVVFPPPASLAVSVSQRVVGDAPSSSPFGPPLFNTLLLETLPPYPALHMRTSARRTLASRRGHVWTSRYAL